MAPKPSFFRSGQDQEEAKGEEVVPLVPRAAGSQSSSSDTYVDNEDEDYDAEANEYHKARPLPHVQPRGESRSRWRRPLIWAAGTFTTLGTLAAIGFLLHRMGGSASSPPTGSISNNEICSRVIIHNFDNAWGFGSEFGILLRAAVSEKALKGPVLANSVKWIYGDLHHFFLPRDPSTYPCRLPSDVAYLATNATTDVNVKVPTPMFPHVEFRAAHWETSSRVDMKRDAWQIRLMDEILRENSINTTLTAGLKVKEHWYSVDSTRMTLPYGESVQPELYHSFLEQVDMLSKLWRPSQIMQGQIDRLATRVELVPGKWEKSPAETNRRPVVVLQIRLGDKKTEQGDVIGAGTHMKYDDLEAYYEAARLALTRVYDKQITPPPHTFPIPPRLSKTARTAHPNSTLFEPIISRDLERKLSRRATAKERKRPLLIIMSAESDVLQKITNIDRSSTGMYAGEAGGVFDVVQSPSAEFTAKEEAEYEKIFGKWNGKVYRPTETTLQPLLPGKGTVAPTTPASTASLLLDAPPPKHTPAPPAKHDKRWQQYQLYHASEGLRLALSRQLIAELTVYSQMADAFVVSGNSNLGRMGLLLGGVEGGIGYGVDMSKSGPVQDAKRAIGGRIRSIDVPFYPTAYRAAIFPP